jgi:hypothetical protein
MKLDIKYPAVKVAKSMLEDISKWVNEELANSNNEDLEGFELSEMLVYEKDGFFDFSNATFDEVVKALAFAANKHIGLEIEVEEK